MTKLQIVRAKNTQTPRLKDLVGFRMFRMSATYVSLHPTDYTVFFFFFQAPEKKSVLIFFLCPNCFQTYLYLIFSNFLTLRG